jgi:methionine biosynthesis protein MetW
MAKNEGTVGITKVAFNPLRYERLLNADTLDKLESDWLICRIVPERSRVLDIGCGTGVLMDLLQKSKGVDIVGIEPNAERAEVSRRKGFIVFDGYVSTETLEPLGQFDVILLADVLEHLPDPYSMLSTIKPYLKSDGRLVVSVPNVAHWSVRLNLLFGRFDYQSYGIMDATHLRWFTDKGIRLLLTESGYKIETIQHSLGFWMDSYRRGLFGLMPRKIRRIVAQSGLVARPKLFGCQHVIHATLQ